MKFSIKKKTEFKTGSWLGGSTTEMAIFPKSSSYLDRDFLWRLSSATVEAEESDFTRLPDFDRVLAVLEGELVLEYDGERVKKLKELESDSFDGAWKTKSYGRAVDFNLMIRKGSRGTIDVLQLTETAGKQVREKDHGLPRTTHALYCKEGYLVVRGKSLTDEGRVLQSRIEEGDLLIVDFEHEGETSYSIMGEGTVLRARISYADDAAYNDLYDDRQAEGLSLADDFRRCIYIANTQFKGAKYIVRSLRRIWYAPQLRSVVEKLERRYVTFIVFFAGLMGVLAAATAINMSTTKVFIAIGCWILVDSLLVSPFIYLACVPRPLKRYMIPVEKLSDFQRRLMESESGEKKAPDKILKNYKNSGKV